MATSESSSLRRLSPSDIGDYGLLFYSSSDPLSRIVMAITKQEFSDLAFYYRHHGNVNVIVVTPFEDTWFKRVHIDTILRDPTTTSAAIKRLDKEHEALSLALFQLLNVKGNKADTTKDFLRFLVGVPCQGSVPCCGIELVNRTMALMDKCLHFSDNNTISTKTLDDLDKPFDNDRGRLLAYLCSTLTQAVGPRQMQSYIAPDGLFAPLTYLRLDRERHVEQMHDNTTMNGSYTLVQLVSLFLDMLRDDDFYSTVCRGVTEGKKHSSALTRVLTTALSEMSDSRVESLQYIINCLVAGDIHISHIRTLVQDANQDADKVSMFTKQAGQRATVPSIEHDLRVVVRTDGVSQSRHRLRQKTKELYQMVNRLVTDSKARGQGSLDINHLAALTSELAELTHLHVDKIPELPDNSSYSIIARTDSEPIVRLLLDSGNEIHLSIYGSDLSAFSRDELLEILEELDGTESERFDNLRAAITAKLAE